MANSRLCSIPNCGKSVHAKGYCGVHYMRLRQYGDPLGGGTAWGEPIRWLNDIAFHHTGDECLLWPFSKDGKGYGQIRPQGKMIGAHRYICELAHGEPPTPEHEAAHSCGNGGEGCVNPRHLGWKTHVENMADKLVHDTHQRGERSGTAKLTETDVREIFDLKGVETQHKLAARFGVSPGTVAKIHIGMRWAWLTGLSKPSTNLIIE